MSESVRVEAKPILSTEDEGHVRHLVLDRPEKRNALNGELVVALRDAAREAADDRREPRARSHNAADAGRLRRFPRGGSRLHGEAQAELDRKLVRRVFSRVPAGRA